MLFQHRYKQLGYLFVRFLLNVSMIEPDTFFIIKFCTRLAATMQVEQTDQLVHRHHFLVVTRIPSQQSKEIDNSLGQIT